MKTMNRNISILLFSVIIILSAHGVKAAANTAFQHNTPPKDTAFSAMKDTTAFKNKLSQTSKNLKTLESDFIQEKHMDILTEASISKGHFSFKNGNLVRWEYTDPFKYIIIINDGKIAVIDEKRTSSYDLTANSAFIEINSKLAGLINGDIVNSKNDFRIKYFENEHQCLLKLAPIAKNMKDYFKSIFVWFDKSDYTVAKIRMTELSGDFTEICFTGKKINQPIADDRFVIK
jgi:outer membrane lipoprotein-sorting protein